MPRIRSLKPEHKQHRKVGLLTHRQYRLWVGMVTEADDDGRLCAEAAQLRAVIFAYHPSVTVRHIADDLATIEALGLIRLYRVNDTSYAYFPSWRDHQKLDRAHYVPSRLPLPSNETPPSLPQRKSASDNNSTTESLQVDSSESPSSQGREPNYSGNLTTQGTEGKGGESRGGEPPGSLLAQPGKDGTAERSRREAEKVLGRPLRGGLRSISEVLTSAEGKA